MRENQNQKYFATDSFFSTEAEKLFGRDEICFATWDTCATWYKTCYATWDTCATWDKRVLS